MSEENIKAMGSLLSKMTKATSGELRFDKTQVTNIVEILIPRMITSMPGMPKGMTCDITDKDDKGWNVRIEWPDE